MSGQLSKRQQARNERILQDLIKTVPGNNVCADCQARNPGWASWSLGIFLCMRCAAIHRKLGTHITKVKSLSMDSWSHEQVETMKRVGNLASNRIYNPKNARAPTDYNANEPDAAMERFIRQKYQEKVTKVSQLSSLAKSDFESNDHPPPLPPKTGTRFGLRSASSMLSLSSHHTNESTQQNRTEPRTKIRSNKPSRVFGITVEVADDYESKNLKLCEMGFLDQMRNMAVLKRLGGNLEKSIETLVSFGNSYSGGSTQIEKPLESTSNLSETAKIPSNSTLSNNKHLKSSNTSFNPFALVNSGTNMQPQSSDFSGAMQLQNKDTGQQLLASNLKGLQSSSIIDQKMQHMSLNKSQSLFPNHTGPGFPGVQFSQAELYQKSLTPPVPYLPYQYHSPMAFQNSTQATVHNMEGNPFNQQFLQALPIGQTINSTDSYNYNSINPSPYQNPTYVTHQNSSVNSNYLVQLPPEIRNPHQNNLNPFLSQPISHTYNGQQQLVSQAISGMSGINQYQGIQQKTTPSINKPAYKIDSQSILDLYNYPHLAPNRPVPEEKIKTNPTTNFSEKKNDCSQASLSSTSVVNKNPFASDLSFPGSLAQEEKAPVTIISPKISQEILNVDVGWMNGRHSPDAWRSISARSMK